jgi:hypothetical protein
MMGIGTSSIVTAYSAQKSPGYFASRSKSIP